MLDVVVAGFVVVDEVVSPEGRWVSAGGVPTYAGLAVASLDISMLPSQPLPALKQLNQINN